MPGAKGQHGDGAGQGAPEATGRRSRPASAPAGMASNHLMLRRSWPFAVSDARVPSSVALVHTRKPAARHARRIPARHPAACPAEAHAAVIQPSRRSASRSPPPCR